MDLNTLLSIAPKIVLFLLFFLSIALFFEFFYLKKKKKEKVLTPQAIPELPKENTGTAKFATSYKAAAVKKKLNVNKKVLLSLILVGVTTVSGLSVYLATRPQPQTTTSKASSEQPFRVNAIHERIGNTLRAGGLFYILGVPLTLTPTTSQEPPTPTPCVPRNGVPCPESPDLGSTNDSNTNATINITLNIRKFHCENNEPNPQGCAENETNETRTGSIEPGRPNIELVGLINMNQCGQYQIDTDYTAIDTSTGNTYRGEAGAITGFTTSCNIEPTGRPTRTPTPIPPPGATNTPIPTNTSIPTPTRATTTPPPGSTATPIPTATSIPTPTRATTTPPPGSTATPIPTATQTPAPTQTPAYVDATATPTPYIVVRATNTPGPSTAVAQTTVSPTMPEAGSPLPYLAVGIPLILILLAFLL